MWFHLFWSCHRDFDSIPPATLERYTTLGTKVLGSRFIIFDWTAEGLGYSSSGSRHSWLGKGDKAYVAESKINQMYTYTRSFGWWACDFSFLTKQQVTKFYWKKAGLTKNLPILTRSISFPHKIKSLLVNFTIIMGVFNILSICYRYC